MATTAPRLRRGLGRGRPPSEELKSLRRLLVRIAVDERQVIKRARIEGLTWREIGDALGMTESGARRKYVGNGIV